jgi:hypothetical protein
MTSPGLTDAAKSGAIDSKMNGRRARTSIVRRLRADEMM